MPCKITPCIIFPTVVKSLLDLANGISPFNWMIQSYFLFSLALAHFESCVSARNYTIILALRVCPHWKLNITAPIVKFLIFEKPRIYVREKQKRVPGVESPASSKECASINNFFRFLREEKVSALERTKKSIQSLRL